MGLGTNATAGWVDAALAPLGLRGRVEPTGRGHRVVVQGSAGDVPWQLVAEWDGSTDGVSGTVLLTAPGLACAPLDLARVRAGESMPELTLSGWQAMSDLGMIGWLLDRLLGRPRAPADPLAGLRLRATPDDALDPALLRRLAQWPGQPAFQLSVSPMQPLRLHVELWDDTPPLAFALAWWQDLIPALQRSGLVQRRDPAGIRPPSPAEVEQLMALTRERLHRRDG